MESQDYQIFERGNKLNFSKLEFWANLKHSIEMALEELKPVAMEENEIAQPQKLVPKAFFIAFSSYWAPAAGIQTNDVSVKSHFLS